ncbi:MAG: sodium:alanine symporter family protein [Ruminococcaceae bacterium]|nr:sodium:alanine symporter family protein [Oscillospiraceae bacterium]
MNEILAKITEYNNVVNSAIWGAFGLILLIGTGVLITLLTKFFQISHIKHWWKNTIGSLFHKDVIGHSKDKKSISPFQALCTALAATIGVGNIAGVAAAIVTGGPGAVFWMWIAAFFGMMTNYAENVLGIYFRKKNADGEWSGGAMYYLRDGLGRVPGYEGMGKFLAALFCVFTLLASFGIGAMGQINKIVVNVESAFKNASLSGVEVFEGVSLYSVILGVILVIIAALITLGGLKRIASFAEKVVPFMVIFFVGGSIILIAINFSSIIPAFKAIFSSAFGIKPAVGGVVGVTISTVIQQGFKRGVFSNEAGLGSSVMVHSNSNIKEPVKQGMWGIFEVFADTMVVCTITALVVLTSGIYDLNTFSLVGDVTDATLVASAFDSVFSFGIGFGSKFVAVAIALFAFTTVLGWDHYGSKAWEYLFGSTTTKIYKVIHLVTIFLGAVLTSTLAWDISDTFNGLMMIPNLIGVVAMSSLVFQITKNYIDRNIKHKTQIKPMLSAYKDIQKEQEKDL